MDPVLGVILPDGRFDHEGSAYIDDTLAAEATPVLWPHVSMKPVIQNRYELMRIAGQSHNMAEMLATRTFPGVKTDSIFNEGKFSGTAGRCGPEELWLRQQAEAAGVSTNGKWYCRGLASFPGDPAAWVGDRGDVLRVAREKNFNVHGYVEHQGREVEPVADTPIASDLVDREVADILDANPFANADEIREQVAALRSGAIDDNPLLCGDYTTTDIP